METPARHSFTLDGTTKVFPIPSNLKGDNYVRLEVDGVIINDRSKYDIVNNSIVMNNAADVPSGSQLDVLVVQSEEAIGQLAITTNIDIVAQNIDDINSLGAIVADITLTADNIVDIQNAEENAASALASKNAAAASQAAAATSATNAANSATASATNASNSATSATASAASATTATTQASAAATSATNASNSATAAATSATNASNSASSASTSATNASNSASAASSSASDAAISETNAATSESNAATSASTATTQAGIATTQAGNAATSASNAASSATDAQTAQAAAEAALADFNETYLGAQASDPTLDNNSDPVTAGDWYFNTSSNRSRIYDGSAWDFVAVDLATIVSKTSATGSAGIPNGTTAERDGSPTSGYFRFNVDTASFEGYNGTAWGSIGGGATGAGGDEVFVENTTSVTTDYTLSTNKNAMSVGPITIDSGATVTVPSGSRWVVL